MMFAADRTNAADVPDQIEPGPAATTVRPAITAVLLARRDVHTLRRRRPRWKVDLEQQRPRRLPPAMRNLHGQRVPIPAAETLRPPLAEVRGAAVRARDRTRSRSTTNRQLNSDTPFRNANPERASRCRARSRGSPRRTVVVPDAPSPRAGRSTSSAMPARRRALGSRTSIWHRSTWER